MKNSNTLIAKVVSPLKESAMAQAETWAKKRIEYVAKTLADNDNDLQKAAPYPRGNPWNWRALEGQYKFFRKLTIPRKGGSYMLDAPVFADLNPEQCDKFIKECVEEAAICYEAYVHKLDGKVGEVIEAKLQGTALWSESFLNIVKADGTKERWKTQQIDNMSKYGKYFLQFPTRKLKQF